MGSKHSSVASISHLLFVDDTFVGPILTTFTTCVLYFYASG